MRQYEVLFCDFISRVSLWFAAFVHDICPCDPIRMNGGYSVQLLRYSRQLPCKTKILVAIPSFTQRMHGFLVLIWSLHIEMIQTIDVAMDLQEESFIFECYR